MAPQSRPEQEPRESQSCVFGVRGAKSGKDELSHQQGYGEADTAGCSQTDHVNPGDVRVEVSVPWKRVTSQVVPDTDGLPATGATIRRPPRSRWGARPRASQSRPQPLTPLKNAKMGNAQMPVERAEAVLQHLCEPCSACAASERRTSSRAPGISEPRRKWWREDTGLGRAQVMMPRGRSGPPQAAGFRCSSMVSPR